VRIEAFARTDVGRARSGNEDAFLLADLTDPCALKDSVVLERKVGRCGVLLLVADGMGGMAAGEVASAMATDAIYSYLTEPSRSKATEPGLFVTRLQDAFRTANDGIHEYASAHPTLCGMGTTATAAGFLEGSVYVAQVGDSRAYLVRDRRIRQLTQDQSLTAPMAERVDGGANGADANTNTHRHLILQALGPATEVSVAMTRQRVQREDALVLCSDGLSSVVSSDEIADVVSGESSISSACDRLVGLANERGGPDNITIILARVTR
jgi:PPM family protein phosphatase